VRIGWYRSVYNIFHAFAVSSFIDELAAARKIDPRDMWLEVIGPARKMGLTELGIEKLANYGHTLDEHPVDAGRLRNVIERVTAAAKWDQRAASGRHLGLTAHRSFVSYTAVVLSHKAAKQAVIEDQVHVEVVLSERETLLPGDEAKALPEFEKKPLDAVDDRLLEIALEPARPLLQLEELEDHWILQDVSRSSDAMSLPGQREYRVLLAALGQPLVEKRGDLAFELARRPILAHSLDLVEGARMLVLHARQDEVMRPAERSREEQLS
jgi:hypothetical protein